MYSFEEKFENLKLFIDKYTKDNIIVAFSGGVDSSLILKMACESAYKNNSKVYALTLDTILQPVNDLNIAKKVAEEFNTIHIVIKTNEILNAGILNNPINRCYLCKKYLFSEIKKKACELDIDIIFEGTNKDDLNVYRPGIRAIKELGIISPFADLGITKNEIRKMSEFYKISTANKPAVPCLATRFPYNTLLSYENMKLVEKGENFLKKFNLYNVRLRVHNNIARIEVDLKDINKVLENKEEIISYLKKSGYSYVTIDLEGFRSGSMDINLNF